MWEMLRQDMQCEGLLECFHDLKAIDRAVFELLVEAEQALTVDEVGQRIDRERSTAYRSVQRLLQAGFIQEDQVNYDQGGYYYVYRPRDASAIADDLQRMLNDWYAKMGQLIGEFEAKYPDETDARAPVDG
jgi:predicted transcriptional regulator